MKKRYTLSILVTVVLLVLAGLYINQRQLSALDLPTATPSPSSGPIRLYVAVDETIAGTSTQALGTLSVGQGCSEASPLYSQGGTFSCTLKDGDVLGALSYHSYLSNKVYNLALPKTLLIAPAGNVHLLVSITDGTPTVTHTQ